MQHPDPITKRVNAIAAGDQVLVDYLATKKWRTVEYVSHEAYEVHLHFGPRDRVTFPESTVMLVGMIDP